MQFARVIGTLVATKKVEEKYIIRATSVLGDPHAVNWLINKMTNPPLSRLAGEAFSMITGADFEKLGMVAKDMLSDEESVDDGDTANVDYDLDNDLTQPDAQKVIRLWQQHLLRCFFHPSEYLKVVLYCF